MKAKITLGGIFLLLAVSYALHQRHTLCAPDTACMWFASQIFSGNVKANGPLSKTQVDTQMSDGWYNCVNPAFSGFDIIAKCNSAITAAQSAVGPCVVYAPPAVYKGIGTTLKGANNCKVYIEGSTLTYNAAVDFADLQNIQTFELSLAGTSVHGTTTSGTVAGIHLGIGSGGNNTLTQGVIVHCGGAFITNFGRGFWLDGSTHNGTYSNSVEDCQFSGNGIGRYLKPTVANSANHNLFVNNLQNANAGDGTVIDGANGIKDIAPRDENNGGYCRDFSGSFSTHDYVDAGGWCESNAKGGPHCAIASNCTHNNFYGTTDFDSPGCSGDWSGGGGANANSLFFSNPTNCSQSLAYMGAWNGTSGAGQQVADGEHSGQIIFGTSRTGTDVGQLYLGTTAYPALARGPLKIADQGTCTMSRGTCTVQSLSKTYAAAPQCFASWTGTGMLTGLIKVPSTASSVTPASSANTDTAQVNWACLGN